MCLQTLGIKRIIPSTEINSDTNIPALRADSCTINFRKGKSVTPDIGDKNTLGEITLSPNLKDLVTLEALFNKLFSIALNLARLPVLRPPQADYGGWTPGTSFGLKVQGSEVQGSELEGYIENTCSLNPER